MRLFVGIGVGDELRAVAASVRETVDAQFARLRAEPPRIVWVAPTSLHVTLLFLGERPDDAVPAMRAAVEEPFDVAPFTIGWTGLGAFPSVNRPRVIWVGIGEGAAPLGSLEQELTRRFSLRLPSAPGPAAAPFHPHLTLARVKTGHARAEWPAILKSAAAGDAASPVTHVSLYRSRGLPGGVGYEEIGRGGLEGGP